MSSTAVRYQYMPPLSPEEYAELETSIRSHGVMVPILRDPSGVVIDGHHRLRIAESLGVDCPAEYLTDRPAAEMRTLAFELNLNRRHLTREQRRNLVIESVKADPQLSSREHGRRAGVDHKTAESVRQSLAATGEIPQSQTRVGADGRETRPPVTQRPETSSDGAEPENGADGKTYATAVVRPAQPQRSALPPQFQSASAELSRVIHRFERLRDDDRYRTNRGAITSQCLPEIRRAAEVLNALLSDLGHENGGPQ